MECKPVKSNFLKKLIAPNVFILIFSTVSCSYYTEGDYFYFESNKAKMPVWVKGNVDSKTAILLLHGGPGWTTSYEATKIESFRKLENHYRVVYWEQRFSGNSQSSICDEKLTADQFVEDTDILIDILKKEYNFKEIFLMGHSWGGLLGTLYLLDKKREAKISGWIEIDGAHNTLDGMEYSRQYVINYAEDQIKNGTDVNFWENILTFYDENKTINNDNIAEHVSYVGSARGYYYNSENNPAFGAEELFASPISLMSIYLNAPSTREALDIWTIDLSERMSSITIPSHIMWGKHDGILPEQLAYDAYDSIGTAQEDKYLTIFNNSSHSPHEEEQEIFYQKTYDFVEKYREK